MPRKYPLLKPEMLQPADAPITTAQAKKLYREWMLKIRFHDKSGVSDAIAQFSDGLKHHGEMLRIEIDEAKESIQFDKESAREESTGLREEIAEQKKILASLRDAAKDPAVDAAAAKAEIAAAAEELKDLLDDLNGAKEVAKSSVEIGSSFLQKHKANLAKLKHDKRDFLVEYINGEILRSGGELDPEGAEKDQKARDFVRNAGLLLVGISVIGWAADIGGWYWLLIIGGVMLGGAASK